MSSEVSYSRQQDFLDAEKARETTVSVIGLGTVGSNAAVELARLGIGTLHLVDADVVEAHNLPSQRYPLADLGVAKTAACKAQVEAVSDHVTVTTHEGFLTGGESLPDGPVILAVDDMDARKAIVDLSVAWRPGHPLCIDTRMAGMALQIFAFDPSAAEGLDAWAEWWFPQSEAHPVPCGGRSVSFIGPTSGALIASMVRAHVMGEPVHFMTTMDLRSMVFTVSRNKRVGQMTPA